MLQSGRRSTRSCKTESTSGRTSPNTRTTFPTIFATWLVHYSLMRTIDPTRTRLSVIHSLKWHIFQSFWTAAARLSDHPGPVYAHRMPRPSDGAIQRAGSNSVRYLESESLRQGDSFQSLEQPPSHL